MAACKKLQKDDSEKNVVNLYEYQSDKYKLHFALHDPIHCLAPGLFRSLKKGDRKKQKLEIIYEFGNGKKIEFYGPDPLGADDLRILQGLVAMAGNNQHKDYVTPFPNSDAGIQIRENMDLKWDAIKENLVIARGSFRELAKEIGILNCSNTSLIQKSIERMWKVSIICEINKKRIGCKLLSMYGSDEKKGKLFVGLNPIMTKVIFGDESHTRIDMNEVRILESDAARLIHQRLCAWIDPGKSGNVSMDTLMDYVWYEKTNKMETIKKRKKSVKLALAEFTAIGWFVEEYKKDHYRCTRPDRKDKKTQIPEKKEAE